VHIFKGTCAPNGPLVADAGVVTNSNPPDQVGYDVANDRYIAYDDGGTVDAVTFTLDGTDSANRYCGQDITEYQWHVGNVSANCGTLLIGNAIGTTAQHTVIDKSTGAAGDPPYADYTYTLQVKALNDSNVEVSSCATVQVKTSEFCRRQPRSRVNGTSAALA
jgi:hypothetical protein